MHDALLKAPVPGYESTEAHFAGLEKSKRELEDLVDAMLLRQARTYRKNELTSSGCPDRTEVLLVAKERISIGRSCTRKLNGPSSRYERPARLVSRVIVLEPETGSTFYSQGPARP